MKKTALYLSFIALILVLSACKQASPVLKVMIQSEEADTANYEYLVVYDNKKTAAADAFTPDDAVFYTTAFGAFDSDIVGGRIVNTLQSTLLTDNLGNTLQADEHKTAIMQAAADSIDHDIWYFSIIVDGDRYFAFIKLNVNLWTPCILYEYDTVTGDLVELYCWDSVDLLGISIK